jgi:tetratricopeptide (TPR) repeat protein
MRRVLLMLMLAAAPMIAVAVPDVTTYEGTLTIPTYEHTGRELEPPLFRDSTVTGMYPFTTYTMPFKANGPKPQTYRAIFVENEYLKLTYLPELGGRIFSLYDKVRGTEVFYRNDVIKPSHYNPRDSWEQSGLELTGPHDLHMLTLHGEPFWSNKIVRHNDGSISLVLGELDPVYQMKVNLTATLHPGIAALQISVFCYNTQSGRMPQMLWINTAISATPQTRFIYPMTRTVGHTTAEIADWPLYNGIDYSLDRNNKHMLGVFGIDIYDNFQGAYQFDRDYGVFRFADRRIVQGMKLWTFGYGEGSKNLEHGYTDNAGPYVELQSGRYVWDGHYEWVAPHKVESWSEWWVPVAGTEGLTTMTRDVALNLQMPGEKADTSAPLRIMLAATRVIPGATLVVKARSGELLRTSIDLSPAKPFRLSLDKARIGSMNLSGLAVTVTDSGGRPLLDYLRPDVDPGRKEYTPFTTPLESAHKALEEMSVEELTLAAEFKLKELDEAGAIVLLEKALKLDPGYSRAHLLLGINDFNHGRPSFAVTHLEKVVERDPYSDEGYYYLAISQFALGEDKKAERSLYYIWTTSAYYGEREYHLGRLALLRKDYEEAVGHFQRALDANTDDLIARSSLALTYREQGDKTRALKEIVELERIDPTSRLAQAERNFLIGDPVAKAELLRLMGGQSQEAIGVSVFYRNLRRWNEAVQILSLVEESNSDPWGTTPEYYYTLAYCQRRAGSAEAAAESLKKARAATGKVDRFPYREESEAPLAEAVQIDPKDNIARFDLGCLLYYRERPEEAIQQWEAAIDAHPDDFSSRRALGLAYAEQGLGADKAAEQLERAVELNPAHIRTFNDLSNLYARAGKFDEQLALLNKALTRSPNDDDLMEGMLTANLMEGRYDEAKHLIETHQFAPRHRTYGLRDKFRLMQFATGAEAFNRGDHSLALRIFETAMKPPVSLGVDDFQAQSSPRLQYYLGRTFEALGRSVEARQAYEKGVSGVEQLSGDRDSWNSENYFMVLTLERIGRTSEAGALQKHFENFALSEVNSTDARRRAEAHYLLGLVEKHDGRRSESLKLMQKAVEAQPDLLAARLELRGEVLDPLVSLKGK